MQVQVLPLTSSRDSALFFSYPLNIVFSEYKVFVFRFTLLKNAYRYPDASNPDYQRVAGRQTFTPKKCLVTASMSTTRVMM